MPGHLRNRGKRADGTTKWQARWTDPTNSANRKDKQFRDKDVARRWLVRMDAEAHGAMFKQPTNAERPRPFKEIVAVWKETCWTGLSPNTTARYTQILRKYLEPEFGNTPITDITRETTRRYFAGLARGGKIAPGTVRKVHTCLSSVLSEAVELELMPANPCTRMRGLPTERHNEPTFLSAEQVRTLAEAVPAHYRTAIYTAAYTGLRASELWALRRKDVDTLRGVVHVRQAIKRLDPLVVGPPKNGKTHTVTLPRFLRAMLNDQLPRSEDALVFTSPEGAVMRQGLFMRRVWYPTIKGDKKRKIKAALPKELHGLRFHDLRHTAASMLIAQGAHPKVIQDRLGHASITTTMNRYGHLFDGHDAELLAGLDAAHDEAATPPDKVTRLREAGVSDA
jgi:integrase